MTRCLEDAKKATRSLHKLRKHLSRWVEATESDVARQALQEAQEHIRQATHYIIKAGLEEVL